MHYLSPERPKLHYRPAFVTPQNKPVHVLCFPTIECHSLEEYVLWWYLPSLDKEPFTYSSFHLKLEHDLLQSFLDEYMKDPEGVIKEYLNYTFFSADSGQSKQSKTMDKLKGITLDDL